ncbi:MAG TPA: hypothetical protein VFH06_03790 [Candidatus Saccharimonadales bacterium]|nr:hypothetical protein [Candidatus Saccharimonadales bacterium]
MNTPHLDGAAYQNPEQAARYVLRKCVELITAPSNTPGVRRAGEAIYVTMTQLPASALAQGSIKRAVRKAFGMNGQSAAGANPHPAHDIVIDAHDNHVRLYLAPRS